MPCYDPQNNIDDANLRKDLDERTAMLCEAMKLIKEMGLFYRCSARLRQWFRAHQEFDRKRLLIDRVTKTRGQLLKKRKRRT